MKYAIPILTLLLLISCASQVPRIPDITVDRDLPKYAAGTAEAQLSVFSSMGGLRKYDINVSYYPDDDVICLEYKMDFVNHYLFLDRDGRDAFVNALDKYKADYELRSLVNKKSKATRQAYGVTRSLLIWEAFSFAGEGRSHPVLQLGYAFVKGSPYMAINMPEAENVSTITGDKTKTSMKQIFYFTRAQADILVALFEPEYLLSLYQGASKPASTGGAAAEAEEY
jgi:hypothetical protein